MNIRNATGLQDRSVIADYRERTPMVWEPSEASIRCVGGRDGDSTLAAHHIQQIIYQARIEYRECVWYSRGSNVLKTQSSRYHPEFDLQKAREVYRSVRAKTLEGEMITSPYDIYSVEVLRDRLKVRTGTALPTDIFVYCKGEPPHPDCTKVGGSPYWTDDRKWPLDRKKEPLRFLAQFNFLDSKDIVGETPGDVLLLFGGNGDRWLYEPLHFEWLSAGGTHLPIPDSSRLLYPSSVFHGAIYRTADFPKARDAVRASDVRQSWNLPILNGTKIGGRPHFIQIDGDLDAQPEMRREDPFQLGKMMVVPARRSRHGFLCQLGSIQAAPRFSHPWCNEVKPLSTKFDSDGIYHKQNSITFGDMGSIFVYRTETGELWSSIEDY